MGWFGGPNWHKLIETRNFEKLLAILMCTKNDAEVTEAQKALEKLRPESTRYIVDQLLDGSKVSGLGCKRLRAALLNDGKAALGLFAAPLDNGNHQLAARAARELGALGDKEAIRPLAGYLDYVENGYIQNNRSIVDQGSAQFHLAHAHLATSAASALNELGSDAGIVVLLRMMYQYRESIAGLTIEKTLMDITGQDFDIKLDVGAWHNWWLSMGRFLDEDILTNASFAQMIVRLVRRSGLHAIKAIKEDTAQVDCSFKDGRHQSVRVCRGVPLGSHPTCQVRTRVAELKDDNEDELTGYALMQNMSLKIGMFQIEESDGRRYIELAQQLVMDTLLSEELLGVMEVIAGHGDDMEEKLTGSDVF